MKIILDETPVSLVIVTPHGSIQLEVWPAQQTSVTIKPNEAHSDQCLRSDDGTRVILKPRG